MTVTEAQESFKQQSLSLTGHKNTVLNSDFYKVFGGPQLLYRRIKTRSDWFIVKVITTDGRPWSGGDTISEIKIIKTSHAGFRQWTIKNVWDDYSKIINLVDQDRGWKSSFTYLLNPLPEIEIVNLLEETIFREYVENTDSSSTDYGVINLATF
jgi:hypothetical protein